MTKAAKVFFALAGLVATGLLAAVLVRLYEPQWLGELQQNVQPTQWWEAVNRQVSEELAEQNEAATPSASPKSWFDLSLNNDSNSQTTSPEVVDTSVSTYITRNTYNEYTTNNINNSTNNTVLSLNDLSSDRLLFVNGNDAVEALDSGISGQVLQSRGAGTTPAWANAGSATVDWANPGSIGSGTANSGEFTGLSVGSSGSPFQVLTTGRAELAFNGDSGSLSSSGGALFINNTNNTGTGLGIYSNAGASAQGNMINVKVDNAAYSQAAFYMNYDGSSNAVEIVSNADDDSSNALAVTGNNIEDSTVGIIGYELDKGTIKVTHNRPGTGNDQSSSGLSIDLKGSGTRAQGVYVDSTESGGTLGNLLRLRNETIDRFVVGPTGNVTLAGNIIQGANGTNTTYTKHGNTAGDEFFVGTTGAFRVQRSASNSEAFRTQVNGDSQGRWLGTSDGQLKWGSGSATQDVVLRRNSAGVMALEGSMLMNNLNANLDTVIKGVSDSNLLFIDASADAVGIGVSTPSDKLHVAGALRVTGAFKDSSNSAGSSGFILTSTGSGTSWVDTSTLSIGNASTLDSLDSTQFLRSDTSDNFTSGTLTFDAGTSLGLNTTAVARLDIAGSPRWDDSTADPTFTIRSSQGGETAKHLRIGYDSIGSNDFAFMQAVETGVGARALILQAQGGNVSIGTTTTTSLLTVGSTAPFTINSAGDVAMGVNGANTTFTKRGNTAGDEFFIGTNGAFRAQRSASASEAFRTQVNGDTQGRWVGTSDGRLSWGPGNATQDITMRRGAANVLYLDGSFALENTARNMGIGTTAFGTSAASVLAIANSTAPSASITDGIQLFAVDQSGSHELRVRDEAGNVTTLSPHNFSLIDEGPSESLAWAFYSERNGVAINADMTKALRLVEQLSGEQLVHLQDMSTGQVLGATDSSPLDLGSMGWITQLQHDYIAPTVEEATAELLPRAELRGFVEWGDNTWITLSEAVFKAKATFQAGITVWGRTIFKGSVTVNKSTAGKVTIPAGSAGITVQFDQAYTSAPVVYVTPVSVVDANYGVVEVTASSFQVQLLQPLAQDVEFSWLAVMVEGGSAQAQPLPASTTPTATIAPAVSPQPTSSLEPTASPTVSPTPFPTAEPILPEPPTVPEASESGEVQSN